MNEFSAVRFGADDSFGLFNLGDSCLRQAVLMNHVKAFGGDKHGLQVLLFLSGSEGSITYNALVVLILLSL